MQKSRRERASLYDMIGQTGFSGQTMGSTSRARDDTNTADMMHARADAAMAMTLGADMLDGQIGPTEIFNTLANMGI